MLLMSRSTSPPSSKGSVWLDSFRNEFSVGWGSWRLRTRELRTSGTILPDFSVSRPSVLGYRVVLDGLLFECGWIAIWRLFYIDGTLDVVDFLTHIVTLDVNLQLVWTFQLKLQNLDRCIFCKSENRNLSHGRNRDIGECQLVSPRQFKTTRKNNFSLFRFSNFNIFGIKIDF
jgi:hypothetical protein